MTTDIKLHKNDLPDDLQLGNVIAVDGEFMGLNVKRDPLCLIQISSGKNDAHIVQLDRNSYNAPNLKAILENENVTKIFHYGRADLAHIKHYLKAQTNRKIIKAIPVKTIEDVKISEEFKNFCDMILFDTKTNTQFGGTVTSFDWKLLKNFKISKKWMVAGGLNINNIREALETAKPDIVDISSGVEKERGIKCEKKIRDFINYVRKL